MRPTLAPRGHALLLAMALAACAPARHEVVAPREEAPVVAPRNDAVASPPAPVEAAPVAPAAPAVDDAPWEADKREPRIGSVRFRTWIWADPIQARDRTAIGSVRVGTSIKLKSTTPVEGRGCNFAWYAVEPHGFVCADPSTTRDFDTDYWKALASLRPRRGAYPYRYAYSLGAPMYSRVPSSREQRSSEFEMGPPPAFISLGKWSRGHEVLVDKAPETPFAPEAAPPFFHGTEGVRGSPWNPTHAKVKVIPAGSGFSNARAFEAEGRTWLLTPDLFVVPADRARPYSETSFQGVALDDAHTLPVAWVRADAGAPKHRREADAFVATGERWRVKQPVYLTGARAADGKRTYWEAKDGAWILAGADASVVTRPNALKHGIGADERWIEASIGGGTLTAFVGLEPVYATMFSPGAGGVPVRGNDPTVYKTTEIGVFPIQWKDAVETMSPDRGALEVFWFADVPWVQYVKAPLAMHTSYWHDRFGYPMSAECLNVSASDGAWLFDFTLPRLPEGWGSVGAGRQNGPSTRVNVVP